MPVIGGCAKMLVNLVFRYTQAQKGQEPCCRAGDFGGALGAQGFEWCGCACPSRWCCVSPCCPPTWSSGATVPSAVCIYKRCVFYIDLLAMANAPLIP